MALRATLLFVFCLFFSCFLVFFFSPVLFSVFGFGFGCCLCTKLFFWVALAFIVELCFVGPSPTPTHPPLELQSGAFLSACLLVVLLVVGM